MILGVSNFAFCHYFPCRSSGLYQGITGNLYILIEYWCWTRSHQKSDIRYFLIYSNCSQVFFYGKIESVIHYLGGRLCEKLNVSKVEHERNDRGDGAAVFFFDTMFLKNFY